MDVNDARTGRGGEREAAGKLRYKNRKQIPIRLQAGMMLLLLLMVLISWRQMQGGEGGEMREGGREGGREGERALGT